jgi:hypothetical protein
VGGVIGMGEQMTAAEKAAVADRIVAVPDGAPDGPSVTQEDLVAMKLAAFAQSGDLGGIRRLVNELEHGIGPFQVSPWRLAEAQSELALRQRRQLES